MRTRHVQYFLAVFQEGNFTRAAERCAVAQPSLTLGIQALERELGGPLFHRGARGARLSDLGSSLLPMMQQIQGALERAKRIAQEHQGQVGRRMDGLSGVATEDHGGLAAAG